MAFAERENGAAERLVRPSLVAPPVVVLLVAGTLANGGTVVNVVAATIQRRPVRGIYADAAGQKFCASSTGWRGRPTVRLAEAARRRAT